jgi:GT2 family glycosyltransferase
VQTKLSFIVVSHNSADALPGFLSSLAASPPEGRWELVLVDNNSADASVETVRQGIAEAVVICEEVNRGFAAGVNRGAERARGAFFVLANPDISWSGDVFTPLLSILKEHPRAAAVAPRLVFPDGRAQASIRQFPDHGNIWFSRRSPLARWPGLRGLQSRYTLADPPQPIRVPAVAATCLLVRASAFRSVGGMDDGYFLYVEDTDLCRRWADAGWEVWAHPGVTVSHRWSGRAGASRVPARHHRAGVRRYFRTHHRTRRLRNAILFLALRCADLIDGVRRRDTGGGRGGGL